MKMRLLLGFISIASFSHCFSQYALYCVSQCLVNPAVQRMVHRVKIACLKCNILL